MMNTYEKGIALETICACCSCHRCPLNHYGESCGDNAFLLPEREICQIIMRCVLDCPDFIDIAPDTYKELKNFVKQGKNRHLFAQKTIVG